MASDERGAVVRARSASPGAPLERRREDDRLLPGLARVPPHRVVRESRLPGSTHFFFDIGNGNLLAFFDFPGLDLKAYSEVLGGLHHIAISVSPERWEDLRSKLDAAGVPTMHVSGSSLYFSGPDGERLELIKDPLRGMYGTVVA